MKTKGQILEWLDKQPWVNEFYKAVFLFRINSTFRYDELFLTSAFDWDKTEQRFDVWSERNEEFSKWYNSNEKPMSWEEYCEQNPITDEEYYINGFSKLQKVASQERNAIADTNTMSKDLCEAFLAYMKLIQLRNAWVKDYDAEDCSIKIVAKDNAIFKDSYMQFMHGLSFPTHKMADDFMDTFEDLLEVAKPLL